jgi:hypothetical protein
MTVHPDETCQDCSTPAAVTLGTVAYCTPCADTILGPIRARVILDESGIGHGTQTGPLRPDYGQHWADLTCTTCDAEWTGPINEPCAWCLIRADRLVELQRRRLLRPELPDPTDRRHRAALDAWHERLARGVTAGIITPDDADLAAGRWETAA